MSMVYCDRILLGSVLNLIEVRTEIAYEFFAGFYRSFSNELRI